MSQAKAERLALHGFVLLDKPAGMSSNAALQRVKRRFNAQKAGHTGSLDPFATGLLPLAFGDATRVGSFLLDETKGYEATLELGTQTATGDNEGEIVSTRAVPTLSNEQWRAVLAGFSGASEQIPPMYSALKHEGQRLYKLARAGHEVERPARAIHVDTIELIDSSATAIRFRVSCSKGTYVRTLGEDIAAAAGTCGHLSALRRRAVGRLNIEDALPLAALEAPDISFAAVAKPLTLAVADLNTLALDARNSARFLQGQRLKIPAAGQNPGAAGVLDHQGLLIGIASVEPSGRIQPKKVLAGRKIPEK